MKVNPELEVLSKLSEIFSDVKYSSYQGDITVELTGISHDFQELSELLLPEKTMGTSVPTVTPVKELPDIVDLSDSVNPADYVRTYAHLGTLYVSSTVGEDKTIIRLSPQDAKELAEFLNVKADEMLAEGNSN